MLLSKILTKSPCTTDEKDAPERMNITQIHSPHEIENVRSLPKICDPLENFDSMRDHTDMTETRPENGSQRALCKQNTVRVLSYFAHV